MLHGSTKEGQSREEEGVGIRETGKEVKGGKERSKDIIIFCIINYTILLYIIYIIMYAYITGEIKIKYVHVSS